MSIHHLKLWFFGFFLSMFIGHISFPALAQDIDYSKVEQSIADYEKKLNRLQQSIDNTLFDEQELVITLDFDADEIIGFVKQKVVFQAYEGLLRGVQGTLVSRSGNAMDQSILLAKLLGDAGFDARILAGILTQDSAMQLINSLQNANSPGHVGQGDAFNQALAAFNPTSVPNKNWNESQTYQRFQQARSTLQPLLMSNNIELSAIDVTNKLVNQTKPYYWVEYRLGPSDDWQAAHPAFKNKVILNITPSSYIKDSVPEKYHHRVKIEAFIEQRVGDQIKTHRLMPAWEKPSANLFNVPITYRNQPSGVRQDQIFDIQQVIDGAEFFSPMLNGQSMGDQVFDMQGRLIDATAMNTPAGALFQTIGNKGLAAIDALNDKQAADPPTMQLNAQWLQFTFTEPNGETYVQKRYLYQANQSTDLHAAKAQLLSEYVLLANTAEHSVGYLASVYLQLVQDSMPLLKASSDYLLNDNKNAQFPNNLVTSEFEILAQYHWMNNRPNTDKNIIRYRSKSNMLGIKRGYISAEKAYIAVDIINNQQNYLIKANNQIHHSAQAAFEQGLWETASEWVPAKANGLSGNDIDTLKVTSAAQQQNIDWVLHHAKNSDLSSIQRVFADDQHALNRIIADIEMGYSVLVPAKKPKELLMGGWWRINPLTGETLGMTADGGGQSATEYIIEVLQTALGLVRAIGNIQKCEKIKNAGAKVCCLMKAHINNVTGLAVGSFNGAVGGTLASAVFDIADFGKEMATGSGIVPGANFSCKGFEPIDDLTGL